jgi:hypothetical protein
MKHQLKKKFKKPGMVVHDIISALRRLRQEDHEFQASLGYMVRLSQKMNQLINQLIKTKQQKESLNLSLDVIMVFTLKH